MNPKPLSLFKKKTDSPLQNKNSYSLSDAAFYALLSSILAVFVLYVVYFLQSQTVAGGDKTVMRMDLYHQYGPLYAELYDRLTSGESLIYSWNTGLGSSFIGNFFNYCCSPFTLLILLFGHYNIPEAIAVIILMKAAVAAATFTYFVNRVYGTRRVSIGFGLLYAFCGYFVAYSWNIMWLDAFLVFPLVMLGIVLIIRKGKPALYIASLAYTMFTNYYMAYMVCILCVIYFLYFYFSHFNLTSKLSERAEDEQQHNGYFSELRNSRFMMAGFKFALGSFLAFMLTACALIPIYYILTGSSATNSSGAPELSAWKDYFNIFDFLANHLANLSPTIRSSGEDVLPNIYCGVITLFLVPAFIFSKKVPTKRKVLTCVMLGLFYASFSLNFLNYIWHGMHYPNDLPYRYSFAYSFLLLILAYEAFLHIREYSSRFFIGTGVGILAFIVIVQELGSKNIGKFTLMTNIVLVFAFTVILCMIADAKLKRDTISLALVCMIIAELAIANTGNYVMSQSKEAYCGDYYDFQSISQTVDDYEQQNDADLFYREERSKLLTRMDASWMDYNGISVFSSMAYETTAKLHRAFGLFSNGINSYTYNPQTAVYNSMFSIKYIYDKNDLIHDGNMFSFVANNDTFTAYQYKYYLPFVFSVDSAMKDWSATSTQNPFLNQNRYFESATGIADVLEKVTIDNVSTTAGVSVDQSTISNGTAKFTAGSSEGTATFEFIADQSGDYTVYFKSPQCLGYNITADNGVQYSTRQSGGSTVYFSLSVGYLQEGQSFKLILTYPENTSGTADIHAVRLNEDKFLEGYNKILSNGTLQLTEFNESSFEGTIEVTNENALLYTSIPYDKSWKITIDGELIAEDAITPIADALIALPISTGNHTVSFKYEPQGMKIGIIISIIGLLLTLVLLILAYIFKKRKDNGESVPYFFIPADDTDMHTVEEDEDLPLTENEDAEEYRQVSVLWRIIFCYLSLGIYYFVWKSKVFKTFKRFNESFANGKTGNAFAFLFIPIYAPWWISKSSKMLTKVADEYGIQLQDQSKWRFLLGLFGGGFFALGELNDDLNFFYKHINEAVELRKSATEEFESIEKDESDTKNDATEIEGDSQSTTQAESKVESSVYFSKKSDSLVRFITIGIIFFFMCAAYLGIQIAAASIEDETTTQTTVNAQTVTSTSRITVPDTSVPTNTSTTESTTVATTESTTIAETTTVLNNNVMAEAARTLLKFTGVELNDESSILILVSVKTKDGDTIQSVCDRHGVDASLFKSLIVMINDLYSANETFDDGEQLIIPMIVNEEDTSDSIG